MKLFLAFFSLVSISFSAMAEGRLATADDIRLMSSKLGGGIYKGLNPKGLECTVTVIDNGGSGTAYAIEVTPTVYNTANLNVANATVTVGTRIEPRSEITAYGILGVNFESYFLIDDIDGKKTIKVINKIGQDQANAICTIN